MRWGERLRLFGPAIFFWFVMVAIYSTQSAPAGVALTWPQGLRRSLVNWTIWALLTPLMIKVDQWLPVSKEALFKRFAFHIPLGLFFTTLKQLLTTPIFPLFLKAGPAPPIKT